MQKLIVQLKKFIKFLKTDIWRISSREITGLRGNIIWLLRITILAFKGFAEDKCALRASALTFFTLLSLVPVVAMAFGIAQGFGLENLLERELTKTFAGQEEILQQVLAFSRSMLDNTRGGAIAGFGMVFLFYVVLKLMDNIEESFNAIWYVRESRSYIRKFTDYLAIILLGPVLIVLAGSLNVFILSEIRAMSQGTGIYEYVGPFIYFLFNLFPYLLVSTLFTLVYMIMPNTRVTIKSALIAGIIAGSIYQFVQWGYINFQVGVSRYNAIYGSFAALPLFLIWLQLSYLILLLGAEISYAIQHVGDYHYENVSDNTSLRHKRLFALMIMHLVVKRFQNANPPPTAHEICMELAIPRKFVVEQINLLVDTRLITEIPGEKNEDNRYQPACDIRLLSIHFILSKLDEFGEAQIDLPEHPVLRKLDKELKEVKENLARIKGKTLLMDI